MRRGRSLIALLIIGCSSAAPDSNKAPRSEPEIRLSQLSNVSEVARHITGGISVQFRVDVANRAHEAITLKRIDLQSIGEGAYNLPPMSKPFDLAINPGQATAVELWGPAYIVDPTILGANGPVTIRVNVQYDTVAGRRQALVIQQVHPFGQ